uniref:Uncharacterized protein n=1 Tax=Labrus bergylta TaxID=56723 RepID=A0A3Q3GAK3_9LABR
MQLSCLIETTTSVKPERDCLPAVLTSLNTCEISLDVLFMTDNTTTLADLQRMLVEEWDAIPQQCVTRLVTSMRRRCQAVVAVYGSSARSCLLNE